MILKNGLLSRIAAVAAVTALMLTGAAVGANGPPPGRGGGQGNGGGGGGETTVPNNLSVPAVFIGAAGFGLTNPALQPPTGDPTTGWEVDPSAYYFVQGANTWQAQYVVKTTDTATAKWGDNLAGGSASLKAGHPVRVEMGLTSDTETALEGYTVVKLQPSLADRVSKYGTLATGGPGAWSATPVVLPARVWVNGATLTISGPGGTTIAPMPGEINATGAVVFGYNWRPSEPGQYTLTFNVPSGTVAISNPANQTITATVVAGGGGGPRR